MEFPTPLARYLNKHRISHSDLARRVGVTDSYIWRLARGQRLQPSLEVALNIQAATRGQVKAGSWPHLRPLLAIARKNPKAA